MAELVNVSKAEVYAELLEQVISDLSEDHYAAGWMMNCEYDIWYAMETGNRDWGMGAISDKDVAQLRQLSADCGGWVWLTNRPGREGDSAFVSMDEWRREYARFIKEDRIPSHERFVEYIRGEVGKVGVLDRVRTEEDVVASESELAKLREYAATL